MTESLSVVAWGQAVRGDGTLYVIKILHFLIWVMATQVCAWSNLLNCKLKVEAFYVNYP